MSGPAFSTTSSITTPEAPLHVFLDETRHHLRGARFEEPANGVLHNVGLAREPTLGDELAETFMQLLGQFNLEGRHIDHYIGAGPNGKNDPLAEIRWQSRREFGQSEKRSSSVEDSLRPRAPCSEDTNSSCSGGCSSIPGSRGAPPSPGTAESSAPARSPCRPSSDRFGRPRAPRRP